MAFACRGVSAAKCHAGHRGREVSPRKLVRDVRPKHASRYSPASPCVLLGFDSAGAFSLPPPLVGAWLENARAFSGSFHPGIKYSRPRSLGKGLSCRYYRHRRLFLLSSAGSGSFVRTRTPGSSRQTPLLLFSIFSVPFSLPRPPSSLPPCFTLALFPRAFRIIWRLPYATRHTGAQSPITPVSVKERRNVESRMRFRMRKRWR
jgi:hypothetical protein